MKRSWLAAILGISFLALLLGLWFFLQQKPANAFALACAQRLESLKTEVKDSTLCHALEARFFRGSAPIQETSPGAVAAPSLPIDAKIRFIAFHDPAHLSGFAYCYFSFRGWFNPQEISPEQLSLSASGFSILKEELAGYSAWLQSEPGKACAQSLQKSLNLPPYDLEREMGDKISLIAINPIAAIQTNSLETVEKDAWLTFNHERIHALQVACPEIEKAALAYWEALAPMAKEELKSSHPAYDWGNRIVAVREVFAFQFEKDPKKTLPLAGACFSQ